MVFDPDRDRLTFFNGVIWELNPASNFWEWKSVDPQPSNSRSSTAFVYDSLRRKIVLFGGIDAAGDTNETWEWDAAAETWTKKSPSTLPPKTLYPAMAFDPVRARMVMITSSNNGQQATWEWDGTNWAERLPVGAGTPFAMTNLQWDSVHSRILGVTNTSDGPAVWQWKPTDRVWTQLSFGCAPPSPGNAAVAFLPGKDQIVFTSGENAGTQSLDLWVWAADGTAWKQYQQSGTWPATRYGASLVYDSKRNRVVMFHGFGTLGSELWFLTLSP